MGWAGAVGFSANEGEELGLVLWVGKDKVSLFFLYEFGFNFAW
jgi:hypothetical protein